MANSLAEPSRSPCVFSLEEKTDESYVTSLLLPLFLANFRFAAARMIERAHGHPFRFVGRSLLEHGTLLACHGYFYVRVHRQFAVFSRSSHAGYCGQKKAERQLPTYICGHKTVTI